LSNPKISHLSDAPKLPLHYTIDKHPARSHNHDWCEPISSPKIKAKQ
jgi:hypothetical protein